MGGAAVPFREAATPDRAVVVGGLGETPRNCDDDTIVAARINEIRSLSLISALRVNSARSHPKATMSIRREQLHHLRQPALQRTTKHTRTVGRG
jgi:hypothetical protein